MVTVALRPPTIPFTRNIGCSTHTAPGGQFLERQKSTPGHSLASCFPKARPTQHHSSRMALLCCILSCLSVVEFQPATVPGGWDPGIYRHQPAGDPEDRNCLMWTLDYRFGNQSRHFTCLGPPLDSIPASFDRLSAHLHLQPRFSGALHQLV